MEKHSDLRALIESMSGSEKRYFKLNGDKNSRNVSGRFMELFDAIDKGYELDRRGKENRAVTVRYLTESILDCLAVYKGKNSTDARLGTQIRHGAVLYNKGLHRQALKVFAKAEKVATEQQDFVRLQHIYWYMRTLLAIGTEQDKQDLGMEQVLKRNLAAAQEITLIARLRFVQYRFQNAVSEVNDASHTVLDELKLLVNSDAMNDVNGRSGFFSQLTADNILSQYFLLSKDHVAGLKQGKKVFDLCYSHRELLHDRGRLLIGSANNYMGRCFKAKEFGEMKRVLNLLEKEKPKHGNVEVMRLESYYSNLLIYTISTKQFGDKGLLSAIENNLEKVSPKMNQAFLMLIYGLCSYYAFYQNNLGAAIKWINLYLNHENRNALKKNLSVAFDYRLIIYYEQNKFDLLESLLRSKQEQSTQVDEFPQIRKLLRKFFVEELEKGTERAKNLNRLHAGFLKLKATGMEKSGFDFFSFDEWAELKIKNG